MMEHRLSTRRFVNGQMLLNHPHLGLMRTDVRDLSFGGLYFNARPPALSVNTPVELVYVLRDRGLVRLRRIPALVVRVNVSGAALMFDDSNAETYTQMLRALTPATAEGWHITTRAFRRLQRVRIRADVTNRHEI